MIRAVLAGGRSKRFGKDKLLALVDGKTSIERIIENIGPDVLITTSVERCRLYWNGPCIIDQGEGPAEAVLELSGEAIVVPGDMPWLKGTTIEALKSFADVLDAEIALPLFDETVDFSIMYIRNVDKLKWLKRAKRRSLRMTDLVRAGGRVALIGSRLLTRDDREWAHLNTPLALKTMDVKDKPSYKIITFETSFNPFETDEDEVILYRRLGLKQLEVHALKDLSLRRARVRGAV